MAKKRTQVWIAFVAVALAMAAAFVVVRGLNAALRPVKVVEAATTVPAMTPVTAADLTTATVPRGQLGKQAYFYNPAVLVGRFPVYGLFPGEIVTPLDIAPYSPATSVYAAKLTQLRKQADAAVTAAQKAYTKAGGTLPLASTSVPAPAPQAGGSGGTPTPLQHAQQALTQAEAERAKVYRLQAVTVSVTEQRGFAIVKPGDRVTIFGTVQNSSKKMVAFAVANDVTVLGQLGTAQNGALNGAVSGTLVLALSPSSVERLMLAEQAGKLQVALMPLGAPEMTIGTVTTTELLGGNTQAQPAMTYPSAASATAPGAVAP